MAVPQPTIREINQMWRELKLTLVPEQSSDILELIEQFQRTFSNGGAVFARFRYEAHPILDWFIQTRRLTPPAFDFISAFLTHPIVRDALPELKIPESFFTPMSVELLDTFELEASLSRNVFHGGAYTHRYMTIPPRKAKALAGQFVNALGSQVENEWFALTRQTWSDWFHDVAWDATWLGLDTSRRLIWVFCVTDSD